VVVIDTKDLDPGVSVSTALGVVEQLIVEKNADFILGGPVRSEAALAAMDLLSKHNKISILTTGVLTPKYHALIQEDYNKYKNCFRITGEAKWLVKEIVTCLADIKEKYKLDKMQLMLQDVAHSRAGGDIIAKIAAGQGWTITGKAVYPTGSSDFSRGLDAAAKSGTQVLLIWMDMPESAQLLQQWYDMKIPALPFGSIISAAEGPDFWDTMGKAGEFCLANVVNAGNAPSEASPTTMAFYKAYARKWGIAPEGYGSSSSYMAPYVLKDAIERANSLNKDKVIAALETTNLIGVYGRIRFDKKSHQIIPSFDPRKGAVGSIFQWQDGERVVVFPSSIAKSEIKLPPWMKP
jgi:branched-chain amino acid transport system substrate-binding protein